LCHRHRSEDLQDKGQIILLHIVTSPIGPTVMFLLPTIEILPNQVVIAVERRIAGGGRGNADGGVLCYPDASFNNAYILI
jgi:hypothetical protein